MFESYVQLAQALLGALTEACLFDGALDCLDETRPAWSADLLPPLRRLGWADRERGGRQPTLIRQGSGRWVTALPLETTEGELLGVFCIEQPARGAEAPTARLAAALAQTLKPVLDSLHRELAARQPEPKKLQTLTERTAELEWLFKVTGELRGGPDEQRILEQLLSAATQRLHSAFGVLYVPDKHLCIEHMTATRSSTALRQAWTQTSPSLLTWAQRQRRPLVMNSAGRTGDRIARCKILSVPIVREPDRVIGLLAFFNPPETHDYRNRQAFLARHLGRQAAAFVEAQFDLMTGLYTRDGLEQMYGRLEHTVEAAERSVIYIDIDHMHVVNELHGFELGNELIVRIADLLVPPQLPEGALAARISADRFVVILGESGTREAVATAERLQAAIQHLVFGPTQSPIDISVSCGIAALVSMPQGLARAIAAAELACQTAKKRGRNRIELYACEDSSMMRRHDDVVAVGQLRSAFKSDRLMLYAQRIVPLQKPSLPGGYEILLRLRDQEGGVVTPATLISAAERYQLLPSVDRWVAQRTLKALAPYRSMLKSRGITLSINVSGQSVGSDEYTRQLLEDLKAANLPPGSLSLEITEQAAMASLARANEMIRRLETFGCRFALDDFGTGANSLTYLQALPIARVKIDGSFVRDIETNPRSQATVRGIVELARGLALDTVAEFVETETIAKVVRRLGVDYAQGFAYGRPEPLDEVLRALAHDESRRLHRLFLES